MNINTDLKKENTYDAIVIGSGISGGWAAKELTEKGLKVLIAEDNIINMIIATKMLEDWNKFLSSGHL